MTRRRTAQAAIAALALALGVLGGCSSNVPEGPVSDEDLFTQIRALPGVTDDELEYSDIFGYGPMYLGKIYVDPRANGLCVYDQALGILYRGGRPGVPLWISVVIFDASDGSRPTPTHTGTPPVLSLDELSWNDLGIPGKDIEEDELLARYGPRLTGEPGSDPGPVDVNAPACA